MAAAYEEPVSANHELTRPASFAGRLRLHDYMFQSPESDAACSKRRSPRLAAAHSGLPSPTPSTATTPTKRKTRADQTPTSPTTTTTTTTPSPRPNENDDENTTKKKKKKRSRAAPAPPSTYAHLPLLPDALAPDLIVLFVGLNPGLRTSRTGHAYAHPSNLFWKLLHASGATPGLPRPLAASEDRSLPARFALGLTNLVARPSRNGAELGRAEMDAGVAVLEEKVRRWRPEVVCLVGKGVWESVWRVRRGRPVRRHEFAYGWQPEGENMGVVVGEWEGARVFAATSTSGLAATLRPAEKERVWRELGVFVQRRRAEREAAAEEEKKEIVAPR